MLRISLSSLPHPPTPTLSRYQFGLNQDFQQEYWVVIARAYGERGLREFFSHFCFDESCLNRLSSPFLSGISSLSLSLSLSLFWCCLQDIIQKNLLRVGMVRE